MKKLLGIALAGLLVFGVAGPAAAWFDYGNLHFVGIEDSTSDTKHDAADGTYEYHADLGDFSVLANGMGPGEDAGMVGGPISVDTGMTLNHFDATSWDDIYFGGYGQDALWYPPPGQPDRVEYPSIPGAGVVFLSAHEVTSDHLASVSGTNIIALFDGTKSLDEGQAEMTVANSYLNQQSEPETGNYNNSVNISGEAWNAELAGLGNMFLYGFDKTDPKNTLTKLTEFELHLDPTDSSLVVSEVPVPASVLLLGSGLLGLFGIRRKKG